MSDVFISYKSEDRDRLMPLVAALEAEGFTVWWDQNISGGSNWREEIERNLDSARCVIVAWSTYTVGPEGRFVRDEAGEAQAAGLYLPITIDDVRPPLGFRETQAIALERWKGDRADPRFQALAAAVRSVLEGEAPAVSAGAALSSASSRRVSRRTALVGTGVLALGVAGGGGAYLLMGDNTDAASRIAVLPFANLSGDPSQDYFSDGLSEELRGALSRAGLQVIGRTSSQAVAQEDTAKIVAKLGVSHILTGSVRKSPEQIRVSAQLIDGRDGVETWTQNYDRAPGEAIALQTDIATQVAQALRLTLGTALERAIELGGTTVPEAQDLYYEGLAQRRQAGSTRQAIESQIVKYRKVLDLDPNFARAWLSLGSTHAVYASQFASGPQEAARYLALGETEVRKGIAIAPKLGVGYAALANISFHKLQFRACLEQIRRAIAMAPNDVSVLVLASNFLPDLGSLRESRDSAGKMVSLEPLNPVAYAFQSRALLAEGHFEEAIAAAKQGLEIAPVHFNLLVSLGNALAALGRFDEAAALAARNRGLLFYGDVFGAIAAFKAGNRAKGEGHIAALRADSGDLASYQFAQIYAQANRLDDAFAAIDKGIEVKDPGLILTMRDPLLRPLHKDRRFAAVIRRLDFPIIDPGIGQA